MTTNALMTDHHGTASFPDGAPAYSVWRVLALETRNEFLKLWRLPAYTVPVFAFPLLFYVLFGLAMNRPIQGPFGPIDLAAYMLVSYGAFGVIGANLFSLGVGLATERAQGWMLLKRATPMPPVIHFLARLAVGTAFSIGILAGLFALGALFGDVRLPAATWLAIGALLVAGGIPFAAMGMALGYLCGPNSAPPVINLIYLPMAFASGLWVPLAALPSFFQTLAPYLPPYHLAQQGYALLGAASTPPDPVVSVLYLALVTGAGVAVGVVAWRRDAATFG